MDRRRRNAASFLPLRPVEFHILLSLAAGERHGYGILQDAESLSEGTVPDVGTLYRALRRIREQGLIADAPAPPAGGSGDERRNDYRITAFGRQVAELEARRLARLIREARLRGLLAGVR
jgi:DNA-binding PadR family transcriptional regulator